MSTPLRKSTGQPEVVAAPLQNAALPAAAGPPWFASVAAVDPTKKVVPLAAYQEMQMPMQLNVQLQLNQWVQLPLLRDDLSDRVRSPAGPLTWKGGESVVALLPNPCRLG